MDYFLLVLAILFVLLGIAGCLLPVLPGPPLSFLSLIVLHFTSWAEFETNFLIAFAAIAVIVTIADYIFPVWITKKTGGSKAGTWGAFIGLILGIFVFPPFGIIIGPLVGAMTGELMQGSDSEKAFRAGMGSFLGFLLGTGLKLITSFVMTWYFYKELFT
jgi:uncharacterized protein